MNGIFHFSLNQDMFSEELQAVPVELEEIDVTESSRLTEGR